MIFFGGLEKAPLNRAFSYIFQFSLAFLNKIISRGIEVIVSFYKDVVRTDEKLFFRKSFSSDDKKSTPSTILIQDYKNSLLLPKARISLAVHSLAEFNFLFANAYYAFFTILTFLTSSNDSVESNRIYNSIPFLDNLLYSSSLGVFNISYSQTSNILLNGMHYFQVTISCVLILIAIAQYMGLNKPISKEEQLLYKHIQQFNLYQSEKTKKEFKDIFMENNPKEKVKLLSFYDRIKSKNKSESKEKDKSKH